MVYCDIGILGKVGLKRWDLWEVYKAPHICLGMKGLPGGGGRGVVLGRLLAFAYFMFFIKWINGSEFSHYFFKSQPSFFLNILIFLALSILLFYRPLSFNLPDRTGRQGIDDFEKKMYFYKGKAK